ncbi:MAG: nucleotidyltransferase family protein [Coriobacteriales bacterium]
MGNQDRHVTAIITAAGLSSRMGSFKPMLPLGSETISRALVRNFVAIGVDDIVMVTGNRADELEEHLGDLPVRFVRNPHFATTQMSASVRLGFEAVSKDCERILLCPVDMPLWLPTTADKLLAARASIAIPIHGGQEGHPLMLEASLLPALLKTLDEQGLRAALEATGELIARIPVADEGAVQDADTPEDYEKLKAILASRA